MNLETYLKEIKERIAKATPGRWSWKPGTFIVAGGIEIAKIFDAPELKDGEVEANTDFIANSRTDIEKLVKMVEVAIDTFERINWNELSIESCKALDAILEIDWIADEN